MQSNETSSVHEELPTTGPQRLCTCGFKTSPWGDIDAHWDAHLPTPPADEVREALFLAIWHAFNPGFAIPESDNRDHAYYFAMADALLSDPRIEIRHAAQAENVRSRPRIGELPYIT